MSFQIHHALMSEPCVGQLIETGGKMFFRVKNSGILPVRHAGQLQVAASARFVETRLPQAGAGPVPAAPGGQGPVSRPRPIPLQVAVFSPDGKPFAATQITAADLARFRDRRGKPIGPWTYSITGDSARYAAPSMPGEDPPVLISSPTGHAQISLLETVPSASAAPLLANVPLQPGRRPQSLSFDLLRVGTFVANASAGWAGSMQLLDPDGQVVGTAAGTTLRCPITLAMLGKSRDAQGKPRLWQLRLTNPNLAFPGPSSVSATVLGQIRVTAATLRARLDRLLGPNGSFLRVYGEHKEGDALARLVVTDVAAAETIDMHGLLDARLAAVAQDPGVNPRDFNANTVYTLGRIPQLLYREDVSNTELKLMADTAKLGAVTIDIGPSTLLSPACPAVKLSLAMAGALRLRVQGPLVPNGTLATVRVNGGSLLLEVGIGLDAQGTPRVRCALRKPALSVDIAGLPAAANAAVTSLLHDKLEAGLEQLLSDETLAPRILMALVGAHVEHREVRMEGADVVFEFVAPLEPDPQPAPDYIAAQGRAYSSMSPGKYLFSPRSLGDTWAAPNLGKIDHVVVVMMENRSYDHVLGYRAHLSAPDGGDGLTPEMVAAIQAADGGHALRRLRDSAFAPNAAGLRTRIPKGVGHELADVAEQLAAQADGPAGRRINSPHGFVENFRRRLATDPQGLVPDDVLGFYDERDLPFYAYLAQHYAYCDRYFCSHPGPTLPNRMFSLCGDVQYDRYGAPILDNNDGDNFLLSRALSIYDLLTKLGVSWRVYESTPSVTMLRMFARYATNNTDIAPLAQLQADVAANRLPAFSAVEPAMHHAPQNDDHPDADMHRGQQFLRGVYETLRSNPQVWAKTLLLITYDEHGGLYDHVPPPVAEILDRPEVQASTGTGTAAAPRPAVTVGYGLRVPTFVVSPWVLPGRGPSDVLDHCAILKTVLARFAGAQRPFLSNRVHASRSFDAYLSAPSARMNLPVPPTLAALPEGARRLPANASQVVTPPLSRAEMRAGPVDYHRLTGRWARQLGR